MPLICVRYLMHFVSTWLSWHGNAFHTTGFLCWEFFCYRWITLARRSSWPSTSWWRHQMETFSALLTSCAGNSPVTGEFPSQRSLTRSFDVFFDLRPNKRLSKQSWCLWFETPSWSLWRHCNGTKYYTISKVSGDVRHLNTPVPS